MTIDKKSQEVFSNYLDVSRETLELFACYGELLVKWQSKINLVSGKTLDDIWLRHFLDSAQLFRLLPAKNKSILDVGSGAGFPGLVLVLMGARNVTLIESDTKKCMFLREVLRQTGKSANIVNCRIEEYGHREFDIVTARALAPMERLLSYVKPYFGAHTKGLFPKGKQVDEELTKAMKQWKLEVSRVPSITSNTGVILVVEKILSGPE